MTDDLVKLLALVLIGIIGYVYGQRGQKAALRFNLLKSVVEAHNDEDEIKGKIRNSSRADLIRTANERLRKRRSPSEDE